MRHYDAVVAISRSGTTTEVLQLLDSVRGQIPTVAIISDPGTPMAGAADAVLALPFADEPSVVQTRFATTALILLRAQATFPGLPARFFPVSQVVQA